MDESDGKQDAVGRIPWEIGGEIGNMAVRRYIAANRAEDETIIATVLGIGEKTSIGAMFGQKAGSALGGDYLLVTDQKVVVIKSGVSTWATGAFGVKAKTFIYDHITSIDVSKGLFFGDIEIVVAGMVEKGSGGFFASAGRDSVIQFEKQYYDEVQALARRVLRLAQQTRHPIPAPQTEGIPDQIRKLAELRDMGILSEEEFVAKKQGLLDRM